MIDYFLGGEGKLTPGNAVVALIVTEDGRYLCQLRSQCTGIFYPNHWGLFGGAVDSGETAEMGLFRELKEELAMDVKQFEFFTEFVFDFGFCGRGKLWRRYYLIHLNTNELKQLVLGEGEEMDSFSANELLSKPRLVPYDAFAVWMHMSAPKLTE